MATQLATRDDNPIVKLATQLEARADQFKMVLPAHITPEKLQRTILTAVQSDPDLLYADRQSLMTACMKAAQDGLLPDKREAALVIFSTRVRQDNEWVSVKLVQYLPMVYGLRKKILQSDEISTLETNVVYRAELEREAFIYEAGTEATLRHRPLLDLTDEETTDDQIVAAYSVAVMKDGSKSFEVMRRSEINKVRQTSQTGAVGRTVKWGADKGKVIEPKGPWVDWFGEMARKTVMRRHSKTLPMSGDILDSLDQYDDDLAARSTTAVLGAVEPDAAQLSPPTRDDVADDEQHDPKTGEVQRNEPEESAEEAARRLDAEQSAQDRGLDDSDDQADDEQQPEPETQAKAVAKPNPADTAPTLSKFGQRLSASLNKAETLAEVTRVEDEFDQHKDVMEDAQAQFIADAISAARERIRGGGSN